MKKFLKLIMVCALVSSAFTNAANAANIGEDADCMSFETKAGLTYSVCVDGEVKSGKVGNKVKSELIELARQIKKSKVQDTKAEVEKASKKLYSDYYPGYGSGGGYSWESGSNSDSSTSYNENEVDYGYEADNSYNEDEVDYGYPGIDDQYPDNSVDEGGEGSNPNDVCNSSNPPPYC